MLKPKFKAGDKVRFTNKVGKGKNLKPGQTDIIRTIVPYKTSDNNGKIIWRVYYAMEHGKPYAYHDGEFILAENGIQKAVKRVKNRR